MAEGFDRWLEDEEECAADIVLRMAPRRDCPSIGLCGSFKPLEREEIECGEEGQEAGLEDEANEFRPRPANSVMKVMGGRMLLLLYSGVEEEGEVEEEDDDGVQEEGCWSGWYLCARSESLLCIAKRQVWQNGGRRGSRSSGTASF
jgi:hypothetical protein